MAIRDKNTSLWMAVCDDHTTCEVSAGADDGGTRDGGNERDEGRETGLVEN
jgi:hypothetical protein